MVKIINSRKLRKMIFTFILVVIMILLLLSTPGNLMNASAESVSNWVQTTDDDFKYGNFENVTINGTGADVQLELVRSGEWRNACPATNPTARDSHAMASIYTDDKILMFGGSLHGSTRRCDTWLFDLGNNEWTEMTPTLKPQARDGHAMAMLCNNDKVLLFGGYTTGWNDETWVYDLGDNRWYDMSPSIKPSARIGHSMAPVYNIDNVVLFGGYSGAGGDETWVYDLSQNYWVNKTSTIKPPSRYSTAMASINNDDKIVMFGGKADLTTSYEDTWVYDLSENQWTQMNPPTNPTARDDHAMATLYNDDKIILFGGGGHAVHNQETWVYDLGDDEWTCMDNPTTPPGRFDHAMTTVHNTGKTVMFGGYQGDEDTWVLDTDVYQTAGYFDSQCHELELKTIFIELNWTYSLETGTSLKFQIATNNENYQSTTWNFIGPDGSKSTFYDTPGESIWTGHNYHLWIRWRAYLSTTDKYYTPALQRVTITYGMDSDEDGVRDDLDAYPNDPAANLDTDEDGYPDEWNEGKTESDSTLNLELDAFPTDPAASEDSDGDGYPDKWNLGKWSKDSTTGLYLDKIPDDPAASNDTDNDGYPDEWNEGKRQSDSTTGLYLDAFPTDIAASVDSDGDGYPDAWNDGKSEKDSTTQLRLDELPTDPSASKDTDNDGYPNAWNEGKSSEDSTLGLYLDAFPNDPAASVDLDRDGYPCIWNEGKNESDSTTGLQLDAFRTYPNEWVDTDGDTIGNNADTDDDNDGMPDEWEVQYGLKPLIVDSDDDIDIDGYTNLQEYLGNTDPINPMSKPEKKEVEDNNLIVWVSIIIAIVAVVVVAIFFVLRRRKARAGAQSAYQLPLLQPSQIQPSPTLPPVQQYIQYSRPQYQPPRISAAPACPSCGAPQLTFFQDGSYMCQTCGHRGL